MLVLGIDIGGKTFKVGVVDEKGTIYYSNRWIPNFSNDQDYCLSTFIDQLQQWVSSLSLSEPILAIGVGCPGVIDSTNGICLKANNLKWSSLPVVDHLKKAFNLPCFMINDANAALLGEMTFGKEKYENVLMLTLGTGIGGAIYLNGEIYEGVNGLGAELGHIVIKKGGRPCSCGRRGCFESYASASALEKETSKRLLRYPNSSLNKNKLTAKLVFDEAKNNDSTALSLLHWYIQNLGTGILNLINIFRPEAILLGGGVSKAGENLLNPLKEYLENEGYGYAGEFGNKIDIKIASLGSEAGILGAAALALSKIS